MYAGLDISFAPAETPGGELLLLEQQAWRRSTGLLTRAGAVLYLNRLLHGNDDDQNNAASGVMDCGLSGGKLLIAVYAWPLVEGVRFRALSTIGAVEAAFSEIEEEAGVNFDMTDEARLTHPARRILAATWLTGPYDVAGNRVAPPALSTRGRTLKADRAVYGSVKLTLLAPRHTLHISVDWADAARALNAGWSEFVVAYPEGGRPAALELSAPPGASEMAASGRPCGFSFRVRPADAPWPPVAEPADKYVNCDYCKGECDDGYKP